MMPRCTPADLAGLDMVLVLCAFGVLALAVVVLLLKGWDLALSVRAKRLDALHRRQ
jgi:hypothetical protein